MDFQIWYIFYESIPECHRMVNGGLQAFSNQLIDRATVQVYTAGVAYLRSNYTTILFVLVIEGKYPLALQIDHTDSKITVG